LRKILSNFLLCNINQIIVKILETNIIEHFPQNSRYVAQKVLPLAVIKVREAEAIRIRMIRQSETDQQKSNLLKKRRDNYASKKEFNKTQLMLQSATKEIQLSQNVLNKIQITQNTLKEIKEELVNNIQIEQNNNNKYFKNLYQDLKNYRAKKRHRYEQDLENNRAKNVIDINRMQKIIALKNNVT